MKYSETKTSQFFRNASGFFIRSDDYSWDLRNGWPANFNEHVACYQITVDFVSVGPAHEAPFGDLEFGDTFGQSWMKVSNRYAVNLNTGKTVSFDVTDRVVAQKREAHCSW